MVEETELYKDLIAPFKSKQIRWRVGATAKDGKSGLALAYVDARDVMFRLDKAVGPGNWSDDYKEVMGRIVCSLSVKFSAPDKNEFEWITKSDGAGDTAVEGEKGGLSDAFKRAAVKFGIARYLYYLPSTWVPLEGEGRYAKMKTTPELPKWALPPEERASK